MRLQGSPRKYNIILDTKVLKLFLIGLHDRRSIERCCKDYTEEDFNNLLCFLKTYGKKIVLTPHLLAEVSNFLESSGGNFESIMEGVLDYIERMREIAISKKALIKDGKGCLCKFGFTDASMFSILEKSRDYTMLVTTDKPFLYYCFNNRIEAREFPFLV